MIALSFSRFTFFSVCSFLIFDIVNGVSVFDPRGPKNVYSHASFADKRQTKYDFNVPNLVMRGDEHPKDIFGNDMNSLSNSIRNRVKYPFHPFQWMPPMSPYNWVPSVMRAKAKHRFQPDSAVIRVSSGPHMLSVQEFAVGTDMGRTSGARRGYKGTVEDNTDNHVSLIRNAIKLESTEQNSYGLTNLFNFLRSKDIRKKIDRNYKENTQNQIETSGTDKPDQNMMIKTGKEMMPFNRWFMGRSEPDQHVRVMTKKKNQHANAKSEEKMTDTQPLKTFENIAPNEREQMKDITNEYKSEITKEKIHKEDMSTHDASTFDDRQEGNKANGLDGLFSEKVIHSDIPNNSVAKHSSSLLKPEHGVHNNDLVNSRTIQTSKIISNLEPITRMKMATRKRKAAQIESNYRRKLNERRETERKLSNQNDIDGVSTNGNITPLQRISRAIQIGRQLIRSLAQRDVTDQAPPPDADVATVNGRPADNAANQGEGFVDDHKEDNADTEKPTSGLAAKESTKTNEDESGHNKSTAPAHVQVAHHGGGGYSVDGVTHPRGAGGNHTSSPGLHPSSSLALVFLAVLMLLLCLMVAVLTQASCSSAQRSSSSIALHPRSGSSSFPTQNSYV